MLYFRCFAAKAENSLAFNAWHVAKNLIPIAAKLLLFFLALLIGLLPVKRIAIYLAYGLRLFLCLFCACFALFNTTYLFNPNLI